MITEATLKLTPLPAATRTLRISYRDIHSAARAVAAIMAQPVTPCALEFMDGSALRMVRDYSGLELDGAVDAMLMVEVDGSEKNIGDEVAAVAGAAELDGMLELKIADTPEAVQSLWKTRKSLSPALRNAAPKKINEDIVVPVSRIPALIEGLDRLSETTGIRIINFGHAGNGNIHVNLLLDPDDPSQLAAGETCLSGLFDLVLQLGGTISGEHGIGLVKRDYVSREIDPVSLRLMRDLKKQFDPHNILNPGKVFPNS